MKFIRMVGTRTSGDGSFAQLYSFLADIDCKK
jgi:hypothetical protein